MYARSTLTALALAATAALVAGGWLASDVAAQWNLAPKSADDAATSQSCREVAAELEIMAGELLALDETIARRCQDLYATDPEARLDALTAVTQELIEQRRATIEYLKGAHQKLIVHLIEHAVTGDQETARQTVADCPIVKRMTVKQASGGAENR